MVKRLRYLHRSRLLMNKKNLRDKSRCFPTNYAEYLCLSHPSLYIYTCTDYTIGVGFDFHYRELPVNIFPKIIVGSQYLFVKM